MILLWSGGSTTRGSGSPAPETCAGRDDSSYGLTLILDLIRRSKDRSYGDLPSAGTLPGGLAYCQRGAAVHRDSFFRSIASPKRVPVPAPMDGLDIGEVEVKAIWRDSERIVEQLADLLREFPVHVTGQTANAPDIHKGRVARTAGHLHGGLAGGGHDVLLRLADGFGNGLDREASRACRLSPVRTTEASSFKSGIFGTYNQRPLRSSPSGNRGTSWRLGGLCDALSTSTSFPSGA